MRAAFMAAGLLLVTAPILAQPSLPTVAMGENVSGDLGTGAVKEYRLEAEAADLIAGVLTIRGSAGQLTFLENDGAPLRSYVAYDPAPSQDLRVGFLAPRSGTYRVRIASQDGGSGSYTLKLTRVAHTERMRDTHVHPRDTFRSDRMAALARDVQSGDAGAISRFWTEVGTNGPLVEPITGDSENAAVTFLWRAKFPTDNVVLLWPPTLQGRQEEYVLSRLQDTDVWYKTLRVHKGSRLGYMLSPNDRAQDRFFTWQLDPNNPRRYPERLDAWSVEVNSVLELPGAPDEQWFRRTASSKGRLEQRVFASSVLKGERTLWLYTPPGYEPSRGPYPLVILFDGAIYVNEIWFQAAATLDNLVSDRKIRPPVVCFIDTSSTRPIDLGGLGETYGNAVAEELLPMLRRDYAISTLSQDIVVGGYSSGGKTAALIALRHPQLFGNVLSQSAGFNAGDEGAINVEPNALARMYAASPRVPVRFYLDYGLYERMQNAARPLHELVNTEGITVANRHFRDVLVAKGYDVTARESSTPHGSLHWRATLADGLMVLLAR
jgi:enterochelin esterase-like enzyme